MVINNAVVGVYMSGQEAEGALCAYHFTALQDNDRLTFFRIEKHQKPCNVCTQLASWEREQVAHDAKIERIDEARKRRRG